MRNQRGFSSRYLAANFVGLAIGATVGVVAVGALLRPTASEDVPLTLLFYF